MQNSLFILDMIAGKKTITIKLLVNNYIIFPNLACITINRKAILISSNFYIRKRYSLSMFYSITHHTIFFYALITLLLMMDLGQFFLIGTIGIPLLLCLYCTLLYHGMRYKILIPLAFLQCLEYFCFYNFFPLPCVYLIPITILTMFFKKYLGCIHRQFKVIESRCFVTWLLVFSPICSGY